MQPVTSLTDISPFDFEGKAHVYACGITVETSRRERKDCGFNIKL